VSARYPVLWFYGSIVVVLSFGLRDKSFLCFDHIHEIFTLFCGLGTDTHTHTYIYMSISRAQAYRVDVSSQPLPSAAYDRGYERSFDAFFDSTGEIVGRGGFGIVSLVVEKSTGTHYACKSIQKHLNVPNISPVKVEQHLANIDREIKVLKLLRGTLSVVNLKAVFEDDENIHIVMEYCKGGELYANLSKQGALTEAKVSYYMRFVLQTLAQCHSHKILHRDIKPGNFLLLNEGSDSPLKAVDFGLAVLWERDNDTQKDLLPRTDLGLDGTPWFMAPEVISDSETYPASDVWSAGVMCYQLLSGKLPFDDRSNRHSPSLSLVWRSILVEEVSFKRKEWTNVSAEAKRFVLRLLNKDHLERPTAHEALQDPWLDSGFHASKAVQAPLDSTVVQRLQRFAQTNLLQRTILELVASELIKTMPGGWLPDETVRSAQAIGIEYQGGRNQDNLMFPMSSEGGTSKCDPTRGTLSAPSNPEPCITPVKQHWPGSLKGYSGQNYNWKAIRQASDLVLQDSGHRQSHYLHACSRLDPMEKLEQRKAARLSLDTSVHGGSFSRAAGLIPASDSTSSSSLNPGSFDPVRGHQPAGGSCQSGEFLFPMDDKSPSLPPSSLDEHPGSLERKIRGRNLALEALQSTNDLSSHGRSGKLTNPIEVAPIMKKVGFRKGKVMTKHSLMNGLSKLGYNMEEEELSGLLEQVGLGRSHQSNGIGETEFLASQLDWKDLQRNNKELWIECARKAFQELDNSGAGSISIEKLLRNLGNKIPDEEVDFAVEDALVDANLKDPEQVDFEGFMKLATIDSHASLDGLENFPDRMGWNEMIEE
jgi:serine/threonine protein kinase/Ca2+-binding EF-hand superfamily protein